MNDELRQISDHVKREKKGKDSALEDLLEFWGAWRANVISGISSSSRSPIAMAIDGYNPITRNLQSCKTKPQRPIQPHQTRSIQPRIPKYWPHHRMAQVNQVVGELHLQYKDILIYKYEKNWTAKDFNVEMGWSPKTYQNMIGKVRSVVKKHPIIKRILGRT